MEPSSSRLPDCSLQRNSVSTLFAKLRLSPSPSSTNDAISLSLNSSSLSVADQATRELCRLVSDSVISPSTALLELQSALDGCGNAGNARFSLALVFVKGICYVVQFLFREDPSWGRSGFDPVELHPFVKVLLCGEHVEMELIQQISLFILHNKIAGIQTVAQFLKPFLLFSILRKNSFTFTKDLISSLASISCSLKEDSVCILKLLTQCLKYFPHENQNELKLFLDSSEYIMDSYLVILKQNNGDSEIQEYIWEFLETIFSLCYVKNKSFGIIEIVFRISKRLLSVQKERNLKFLPEFNSMFITISYVLYHTELEHEQLAGLKLLVFLTEWKLQTGLKKEHILREELVCVFPVVGLLMSPSNSIKSLASRFLSRVTPFILDLLRSNPSEEKSCFNWTPPVGTLPSLLFRLLHHVWFGGQSNSSSCFYMEFIIRNNISEPKRNSPDDNSWPFLLREYFNEKPGITGILGAILSILITNPTLGPSSVESLARLGALDRNSAMRLLLLCLFYIKILSSDETNKPELLLKLMESISSFSSHGFMVPIVVQTILPMLKFESEPELYATAMRLLCKAWTTTDRVFANLQEVLDPKAISNFVSEREILISGAASIRDICKHNPDRGVDLILSVSSYIESRDCIVQALGLEGLTSLCEADVVDFYTAWIVIEKDLLDYSLDPIIAHGLATLLRSGAMDAEAYPDASRSVLQILWNIASKRNNLLESSSWVKARVAAFLSLSHYKVDVIKEGIPEFKKRNFEVLTSEGNLEVLKAMEELQIEIIKFEHTNRKRGMKDTRNKSISKTEKLLDVFPQAIFSLDKTKYQDLPGAALLCFNFTPKIEKSTFKSLKDLEKVNNEYEKALKELAESLHMPRNLTVAILSIQSWRSFLNRWIDSSVNFITLKDSSDSSDKSTKAAKYILKILCRIAEESIPRVAVNIALAIGALCLVVPSSAHYVVSDVSDFLLKWLLEYGHEHKQWTAAISLGLISDCFHPTDQKNKFKVIDSLHEVICTSKSGLVRGACGAGLSFALISKQSEETKLLEKIITTLSALISKQCPSTSSSFNSLLKQVYPNGSRMILEPSGISDEEDPWSTAGLVLGLTNSIFALYRSGAHETVIKIKEMLIMWLTDKVFDEMSRVQLCMGACLSLPIITSFCLKFELLTNIDFEDILNHYNSLISEIISINKSAAIYSDLLFAACIGAGTLVSCVLNDGVNNLRFDVVKNLLETIRSVFNNNNINNNKAHSYLVQLGGLIGIVNAFGAQAGYINLISTNQASLSVNVNKEINFVRGPLVSNPSCESICTEIIQEIFILAKESRDSQRRQFSAWALAFLRNYQFGLNNSVDKKSSNNNNNLSEESLVWDLSSWLRDLHSNKGGIIRTTLSCLAKAPRIPSFDWGTIIRRIMRFQDININKECLNFALVHANKISPLLNLLDDLTDFPRFKTLDLCLQEFLLDNFSGLVQIFSGSRLEKFCVDLIEFVSLERESGLRRNLWRGIWNSLRENDNDENLNLEKLMECLLIQLPCLNGDDEREELFYAIKSLDLASKTWLLDILKIPATESFSKELDQGKKIVIVSRLVKQKTLPISELDKIRGYILDAKDEGTWWRVLLEVSSTISTSENIVKQQWLLDAFDISCVSNYPSTSLKFIGLLCGFCCEYMPILTVNESDVLSDLPITLASILSDPNWSSVRIHVAEKVWSSANRVRSLAEDLLPGPGLGEDVFGLASVMHRTCVSVKDYLPYDKKIKLASLEG